MYEEKLRIAVTIATKGRPVGCRRLVAAVLTQELPTDWDLRAVVVDNGEASGGLVFPHDPRVEVLNEPEPGIPFARNRGVDRALRWADVIVFIDDDEVPADSAWLRTLVGGLKRYRADVVSGPVRPVFPVATPDWIQRQPVFQRRRRRSAEQLSETYTGNTAVVADVFRNGQRFSAEFRHTGGSDTEFFRSASRRGTVIRWVEEAAVLEFVPAERATVRWILGRSFRIGANRVQLRRAVSSPSAGWSVLISGSFAELLLGVTAPVLAIFSRYWALLLLGRSARGFGAMAALLGFRYAAYR